jgi:hypothetical protein
MPEQKNLKQRLSDRRLVLLLISLLCFGVLAFFSWLDGATTYGRRHLSFHSPGLDLFFDLAYKDNTVFFSLPQAGISTKTPYWRLARFGKRYWLPIKITIYNILFLTFALLCWRMIKNRRRLIDAFREFRRRPRSAKLLFISKSLVVLAFLLSIFPTPDFNFWWKRYDFIPLATEQSTLTRALYEFMTELLVFRGNRLFYASLFTLPRFILKWVGITCSLLFILGIAEPLSAGIGRLGDWLDKLSSLSHKKWLIGGCLWVFILANLISLTANQHLPPYLEGTAQFFQAQLLAAGKLAGEINFSREFFWFPLLRLDTHWYSSLAPGQSLLLALGHKLGVPWLINPIFSLLAVAALYALAVKIYGPPTAVLSSLLMILSPLYLSLSASYLNHLPFILFLLLALLLYHYSLSTPGMLYPILSGLCWGLAALTRPSAALALGLPFALYLIKQALSRGPGFRLKPLLISAGLAIPVAILIKYNQLLWENPWGLAAEYTMGTWLTRGLSVPTKSLFRLMNNLFTMNGQLWGWIIPAFFLILIWLLTSSRVESWDYLLLWGVICFLSFNFITYDARAGLANPMIAITPLLVLLSARAITTLPATLARFGFSARQIKPLLALGLIICCLTLLGTGIPPLLHSGNSHRLNLSSLIKQEGINNAIIFLREEPFLAAFVYNRPDLSNDIIFARHLKNYNRKLMQEFPQRSYYFYNDKDNRLVALGSE